MRKEFAHAIASALEQADLSGKSATTLKTKLEQLFIDPLLLSMSLDQARRLVADGHGRAVDDALQDMKLAQLKKLSKAWNPNRVVPKEPVQRDLQVELRDLAASRAEPKAVAQPTAGRRGRASVAARSAR